MGTQFITDIFPDCNLKFRFSLYEFDKIIRHNHEKYPKIVFEGFTKMPHESSIEIHAQAEPVFEITCRTIQARLLLKPANPSATQFLK